LPPYLLVLGLGIIAGLLDALEFGEVLLAVRTRKVGVSQSFAKFREKFARSAAG